MSETIASGGAYSANQRRFLKMNVLNTPALLSEVLILFISGHSVCWPRYPGEPGR